MRQVAEVSEIIVVGTIADTSYVAIADRVWTSFTIEVDQVLKGQNPAFIEFYRPGGRIGQMVHIMTTPQPFRIDERYLVPLRYCSAIGYQPLSLYAVARFLPEGQAEMLGVEEPIPTAALLDSISGYVQQSSITGMCLRSDAVVVAQSTSTPMLKPPTTFMADIVEVRRQSGGPALQLGSISLAIGSGTCPAGATKRMPIEQNAEYIFFLDYLDGVWHLHNSQTSAWRREGDEAQAIGYWPYLCDSPEPHLIEELPWDSVLTLIGD